MKTSQIVLLAVVLDLIITVPLVVWLVRRRLAATADAAGLDLGKLRGFTAEVERTVEEHVRGHWSGDPSSLPLVLTSLLATLEQRARDEGYPIERELLKRLMAQMIASRKLVNGRDLAEALKQVA